MSVAGKINPKRLSRQVAHETQGNGVSSYAQAALQLEYEKRKKERQLKSRRRSEQLRDLKWEAKVAKAKSNRRAKHSNTNMQLCVLVGELLTVSNVLPDPASKNEKVAPHMVREGHDCPQLAIFVLISGIQSQPREVLRRTGLDQEIGEERLFAHTGEAINCAILHLDRQKCLGCKQFALRECTALSQNISARPRLGPHASHGFDSSK